MSVSAPTPVVPVDWGIAKAGEVCEVQNGFAFKSEFFNDKSKGLPLIRIRDVHSGRSDTFYSGPFDDKYVVADNDLLIGMDGEFRVRKWRSGKGLLNQRVCRLIPNGDPMTADFLYYSIGLPLKQIEDFTPFTTVKHISAGQIRAIELPLPPLPEQKKITHILSTVQRSIEAQERIIQTTAELKKALMHKLFTEGLRNEPQKQSEIGPIPKSWDVVPLSQCAVVQTGIAKGRKLDPKVAIDIPYLRVANVQDGYLDLTEMKTITIRKDEQARYALQEGDVVLTEGGDFDKLGRGFIWHGQVTPCVHQNHVFAIRPDKRRISSEFLAYQSQSPYGKAYFLSVAHKTTNLACINTTKLKAFPVLLPPQDQQEDIVEACSSIDRKIQNATNKKTRLEELFRALLHELMTAKIRVHGSETSS